MNWRSHPNREFVPDHDSVYITSARTRRLLTMYELLHFAVSGILIVVLMLALMILGVVFRTQPWAWYLLAFAAFIAAGGLLARFRILRKTPLRCSRCLGWMERDSPSCEGQHSDPVFYVCQKCKRYVDSGVSVGD